MTRKAAEILDTTLRDGSYSIGFQFTADDTALIASTLESAGIRLIEVGHGMGLGAARAGKGEQAATDEAYLDAAAGVLREATFGAFFIPGIGTEDDLRMAADHGMRFVRVGTNITETDQAAPYVRVAKGLGLLVSCNLMKSYTVSAESFGETARVAADLGADAVCLVDSAGGMLPEEVQCYIEAARAKTLVCLGFHGHDNLCLATANTLTACKAGATVLDASLHGIGRSEGNAVTEVLAALLPKLGLSPRDMDVNGLMDIADAYIQPLLHRPRRSGIGITSGRARFHSSFLARVLSAATRYGVDVRDLILRLGQRDQVQAPPDLVESLARELAAESARPRPHIRIDFASASARPADDFPDQVRARARELREKASKLGMHSVLNAVVGPYEMTRVSPFVDTNYGCAMSNVMLAEGALLDAVFEQAGGLVDFILLDAGGTEFPATSSGHAQVLTYSDHEMWAHAAVAHLAKLLDGGLAGKTIAVAGVPPLAVRAALAVSEASAIVLMDTPLAAEAGALAQIAPGVQVMPLLEAAPRADAILSLSPRRPMVTRNCVATMRPAAVLYDGGIGSIERDAVAAAEERGITVVRIDMRPSLAATALELIGLRRIVREHMGRAMWNGVRVVAGGLIGHEGEIIVDSIQAPTRVIGVADGMGGVLDADNSSEEVGTVRRVIAEKQITRGLSAHGEA